MSKLPGLDHDPKSWGRGVWFAVFSDALRSRTPETIEEFIRRWIPILIALLCDVCSGEGFKLIKQRHPNDYRDMYEVRKSKDGEETREYIGMYLWCIDIHNDVNKSINEREKHANKHIYPKERVDELYRPLLNLTTEQISSDREAALDPELMDKIWEVSFSDTPEALAQQVPVVEEKKTPVSATPATRIPIIKSKKPVFKKAPSRSAQHREPEVAVQPCKDCNK